MHEARCHDRSSIFCFHGIFACACKTSDVLVHAGFVKGAMQVNGKLPSIERHYLCVYFARIAPRKSPKMRLHSKRKMMHICVWRENTPVSTSWNVSCCGVLKPVQMAGHCQHSLASLAVSPPWNYIYRDTPTCGICVLDEEPTSPSLFLSLSLAPSFSPHTHAYIHTR
jgi:hypothetical protein